MRVRRALVIAPATLALLVAGTISATAAPLTGALAERSSVASASAAPVLDAACVAFARQHARGDWMCSGDMVTDTSSTGSAMVSNVRTGSSASVRVASAPSTAELGTVEAITTEPPAGSSDLVTPMTVVDDYHAHRSTTFYYGSGSQITGSVRFTHTVTLYNHSATDKMSVTISQTGGDLYWNLRIRRDNTLSGDTTVFTYPMRLSCQSTGTTCSATEDRYGDGYNEFPYDGKNYFLDAYGWNLYVGGHSYLNVGGTAQSDRATCYKTVPCRFNG